MDDTKGGETQRIPGLALPETGQSFGLCTTPSPRSDSGGDWPRGQLGLVVVVMVVMMMRSRGKRRSGENQDKEHGSKDLLHGVNLARC